MTLPPVHSLETTEYYVSGAVTIHPSVAIAPGVVIEAGSGQEITIGEGVCIGLGSVITAHHGSITIAAEVTLAPGTLIVGPANLGEAACVGTRSSICGQDIDTHSLIPPGSLLMPAPTGKRQQLSFSAASTSTDSASPAENQEIPSPWDESSNGSSVTQDVPAPPPLEISSPQEPLPPNDTEPVEIMDSESSQPEADQKPPVVGQVYINQLLLTLFPERKYFNRS